MGRITRLLSVVPVAFLAALAGCDNALVTEPSAATAQFGVRSSPRRAAAVVSGAHADVLVGPSGGVISFTGENGENLGMLFIPGGAVRQDTRFTIDISSDYTVDMMATSAGSPVENDVGHQGFRKPLYLYFNTQYILTTGNLGVAEIKAGGQLVPVASFVTSGWLIGELRHFSGYGPTTDRTEPNPPPPDSAN
jgi:hypothetical protein